MRTAFGPALASLLAIAPAAAQTSVPDLSMGTIGDKTIYPIVNPKSYVCAFTAPKPGNPGVAVDILTGFTYDDGVTLKGASKPGAIFYENAVFTLTNNGGKRGKFVLSDSNSPASRVEGTVSESEVNEAKQALLALRQQCLNAASEGTAYIQVEGKFVTQAKRPGAEDPWRNRRTEASARPN